jgi:hypothetical protein
MGNGCTSAKSTNTADTILLSNLILEEDVIDSYVQKIPNDLSKVNFYFIFYLKKNLNLLFFFKVNNCKIR